MSDSETANEADRSQETKVCGCYPVAREYACSAELVKGLVLSPTSPPQLFQTGSQDSGASSGTSLKVDT